MATVNKWICDMSKVTCHSYKWQLMVHYIFSAHYDRRKNLYMLVVIMRYKWILKVQTCQRLHTCRKGNSGSVFFNFFYSVHLVGRMNPCMLTVILRCLKVCHQASCRRSLIRPLTPLWEALTTLCIPLQPRYVLKSIGPVLVLITCTLVTLGSSYQCALSRISV